MQPVERVQEVVTPTPPSQEGEVLTSRREQAGVRFLHGWVVLYFSLFSLVMTWPLALRLRDAVVGQIGDNIYFVFLIRWYQQAWFELGISPFFHPWLNYPQGWNLASTDTSLATTLVGLLFSLLGGPTFGYNLGMLVTFVFSGWAMFFWVRRLTGSTAAGLVAGTIYAFLPYRMAHYLAGHLNLSGTQWFPLYFMGLYEILRGRTGALNGVRAGKALLRGVDWKPILLAAGMLGLIGFTSMYYLYYTALFSVVFVGSYLLVEHAAWRDRQLWKRLALLGACGLPLMIAALLPFLGLESQGGLASRSVSYASMYSANPLDFFLPSTDHFLWGAWVGLNFDRSLWIEATLYIGAVTLALALLAWRNRAAGGHPVLLKVSLIVALAAFVLALGTDLHWNNQRVEVPVPGFLQSITGRETAPVPLPALVLFKYLPFYAKMRALMRIGFITLLFACLAAGLGAGWLLRRAGPRRSAPLAALLIALVFLDFYPGPYQNFAPVAARPVDAWLAQQPGQGSVAQFPFLQVEDQDQVYNTLVHGKPYIGGFFSANQPEQYVRIKPLLERFPDENGTQSAALLAELGVEWVLFDLRQYPDFNTLRAQLEALGLSYVATISSEAVFRLERQP
jgi:hypothetical protein